MNTNSLAHAFLAQQSVEIDATTELKALTLDELLYVGGGTAVDTTG